MYPSSLPATRAESTRVSLPDKSSTDIAHLPLKFDLRCVIGEPGAGKEGDSVVSEIAA